MKLLSCKLYHTVYLLSRFLINSYENAFLWHIIKQKTKGLIPDVHVLSNTYVLFCHNFDIFYHRCLDNYRI